MNYLTEYIYIPRWVVFLVIALGLLFGLLIGLSVKAPSPDDWGDP